MRLTKRTLKVLKNAEEEAKKTTRIVYPVHLLLGMLLERTVMSTEVDITYPKLRDILNERIKQVYLYKEEKGVRYEPFTINISLSTERVIEIASNRMKKFNQIYLNEGHLVDAIFRNNDDDTSAIFDGLDVSSILKIMACPRDMIVSLRDYTLPNLPTSKTTFRKAVKSDSKQLRNFVKKEFGNGWLDSIENGFLKEDIPIFIASDEEGIIGFSCFDVVRNKKGLFGPMGTTYSKRVQGIGYTLLHLCLNEMNKIGYEYAVIGEAGPIEFYEKACNAVVIPKPL